MFFVLLFFVCLFVQSSLICVRHCSIRFARLPFGASVRRSIRLSVRFGAGSFSRWFRNAHNMSLIIVVGAGTAAAPVAAPRRYGRDAVSQIAQSHGISDETRADLSKNLNSFLSL